MAEMKEGLLEEVKLKTETLYAMQKIRIQAELRRGAFVRDGRLTEQHAAVLHRWTDEQLEGVEQSIEREVAVLLKDVPIFTEFLKKVKGISTRLAGSLIAGIYDISRFQHVSALWKYCGMDVIQTCHVCGKDAEIRSDGHCGRCGGLLTGEAPRLETGKKITWDPFLRMTMYKVTGSFVKQDPEKCLYRRLYAEKKEYYKKKYPEWNICPKCGKHLVVIQGKPDKCPTKGCKSKQGGIPHPTRKTRNGEVIYMHTKGHLDNMARRYAGKILLQHLWIQWRTMEGLPTNKPWIIEHGGHVDYIGPEEAVA